MSYKGTDKERFAFLLTWGVDPDLIKRFLTENKKKLILAGAKADNLPKVFQKCVAFVADLPEKTHPIIQDWLRQHIDNKPEETPDQIVFRLLQTEAGMHTPSKEERKRDCQALLLFLLDDDCPKIVLDYLLSTAI